MAFGYPALNAWILGRPDLARQRSAQMMAAVDSSNPAHLLTSAFMAILLDLFMRQYEKPEVHFAQWTGLTAQHQFANYGLPQAALGAVRVQLGRVAEGITSFREGISRISGRGIRAPASIFPIWLAEAQSLEGAIVDALQTIEQALQANPDELIFRPEALRVRGELRAKQRAIEAAEIDCRDAIALAQKISGKSWELRATMSLARLLASKGHRDEARTMLAQIYHSLTEGFDTIDLKEAKTLLEELGGSGARAASV
jgi:predicted ATPase